MSAAIRSLTSCETHARVDILTLAQSEKRQALCFLRIECATQERQLMGAPGLSRFGSDLLFVVDLPQYPQAKLRRHEGTDRQAAASARPAEASVSSVVAAA